MPLWKFFASFFSASISISHSEIRMYCGTDKCVRASRSIFSDGILAFNSWPWKISQTSQTQQWTSASGVCANNQRPIWEERRMSNDDYYYYYPWKWLMIWIRAHTNRNKSFYCFNVICAVCSNSPCRFCFTLHSHSFFLFFFSLCCCCGIRLALNVVVTLLMEIAAQRERKKKHQKKMRKQRDRLPLRHDNPLLYAFEL